MGFAWQIYSKFKDHKVAEVLRPISVFMVATCHLILQGWYVKSSFAFYLLILWTLKHCLYSLTVFPQKAQLEYHYEQIMRKWQFGDSQSYLLFYMIQGLYAWVLALPFYFIAKQLHYSWLDMLTCSMILFALLFEMIADLNLYFYRRNGGNGFYQQGLWRICRHPNYFFFWFAWLGFALLGVNDWQSLTSLLPCIFLYFTFRYTFIPIAEGCLIKKFPSDYRQYQQEVPTFFPFT